MKKPIDQSSLAQARIVTKKKKTQSASFWSLTSSKVERDQAWLLAGIRIRECSLNLGKRSNSKISRTKYLQSHNRERRFPNSSKNNKINSWRKAWAIWPQTPSCSRLRQTVYSLSAQIDCWVRKMGAASPLTIQMLKPMWTELSETTRRTRRTKEDHHIQAIDDMASATAIARNQWVKAYRDRTRCLRSLTTPWSSWTTTWQSLSTHPCEEYKSHWSRRVWKMTLWKTRVK